MNDTGLPQAAIDWMLAHKWGLHHEQWHYCRRFDYWAALAATLPAGRERNVIHEMIDYAAARDWKRAAYQEGEPGSGLDFLAMHRAMILLLVRALPELMHWFRGWSAVPTDPGSAEDVVPSGEAFAVAKSAAIAKIEKITPSFADDDSFGRYLETNLRPLSGEPRRRDPNPELGLHNYLHKRWSDHNSPIDLGDPRVSLFNTRFWRLHGWIDYRWWRFRQARNADDRDVMYRGLLDYYLQMMNESSHHKDQPAFDRCRPAAFARIFAL